MDTERHDLEATVKRLQSDLDIQVNLILLLFWTLKQERILQSNRYRFLRRESDSPCRWIDFEPI